VLAKHYRPGNSGTNGPSWLTFIGHVKDSLWSVDLFRRESILLRSHWVLVVMDLFTRRIIGFGVERADVDGVSVCRMFNLAVAGRPLPTHISTDHDPLFRFHRWLANLRVREIEEIKSVPYVQVFFWNAVDLARKLEEFREYYNNHRVHRVLAGSTSTQRAGTPSPNPASLDHFAWQQHCGGLFHMPIAA
jgi:putative transposase